MRDGLWDLLMKRGTMKFWPWVAVRCEDWNVVFQFADVELTKPTLLSRKRVLFIITTSLRPPHKTITLPSTRFPIHVVAGVGNSLCRLNRYTLLLPLLSLLNQWSYCIFSIIRPESHQLIILYVCKWYAYTLNVYLQCMTVLYSETYW